MNGVGGKIELDEIPAAAMQREFLEETGLQTAVEDWRAFGWLCGADYQVDLFATSSLYIDMARSTDEECLLYYVDALYASPVLRAKSKLVLGVPWMIQLALAALNGEIVTASVYDA